MGWSKISLFKFQQIESINAGKLSDVDKTLFSVCAVFDLTEYQLNEYSPRKATKLITRLTRIMESPFKPKASKRMGKYFVNYDASQLTFGQYVELSFFMQQPLKNAHYIISSITHLPFLKNNSADHAKKSEYFLNKPVEKIIGAMTSFAERFQAFNNEYKSLFGLNEEVNGPAAKEDKFNKRYGWIYSASQIAEYERIPLDDVYKLPIRQALNDLGYLKAKSIYEYEQSKKK